MQFVRLLFAAFNNHYNLSVVQKWQTPELATPETVSYDQANSAR